jgi:signal transduction histidine kinase
MPAPATYRRWTAALLVASAALLLGGQLLLITAVPVDERGGVGNYTSAGDSWSWLLLMLFAAGIGVLVARRRPDNPIGWTFSLGGFLGSLSFAADQWAGLTLVTDPGSLPGGTLGAALSYAGLYLTWGLLAVALPATFPDGRPGGRLRKTLVIAGLACAVLCAASVLHPKAFDSEERYADLPRVTNPIGLPAGDVIDLLTTIGLFGLFGCSFLAIGLLVPRTFRARGLERQQLKVVVFSAVAVTVGLLLLANLLNVESVRGTAWASVIDVTSQLLVLAVPAAFAVALLRYRLYDVDVVINKARVYGSLAVFVTAVYIGVVVGVGSLLGRGDEPNLALSIVATSVVAVGFQPARARIQLLANRVVYGLRASPDELMRDLAPRMAAAVAPDDLLPRMAEFAARCIGAQAATVRLLLPDGSELARSWPAGEPEAPEDTTVDVVQSGERVGVIGVRKGPGDPVTGGDRARLAAFATQAGVPLSNVRLTADLQDKLARISRQATELRESRQRIVEASDAARRQIERNLHDGAQQRLVALGLELRMLEGQLPADSAARAEVRRVSQQLREALAELRELARGIHPAILTEQGLAPALETLVQRAPVDADLVEAPDERLPEQVEAAAYYVVAEALTNVSKYAHATHAVVSAQRTDGFLSVEVRDDGIGGADVSRGSGLRGLSDRIAALDGSLELSSPPGQGTCVRVRLPCG